MLNFISLRAMKLLAFACLVGVVAGSVPTVTIYPQVEMPMLAFGTARTSLKGECTVQESVEQWLQLGGRHIDTADDYGTQPDVGEALKASGVTRQDMFITTKIPGPIGAKAATDKILNTALKQLGIDYIDLVLIHFPCKLPGPMIGCGSEFKAERLDTFKGLLQLRKEGKIRAVGVSNYEVEHVNEITEKFGEPPAVNQVQYHLGYHNDTLLEYMKNAGTVLEAWASLGGPTDHDKPSISLGDPRLKKVASKYNATTPQVVFAWETQKGVVPVTATCTKDHAIGDLEAFSIKLADEDISYLDSLTQDSHIIV